MFDINSKVICVDDRFPSGINDIYNALPKKGTIYTVRDIVPGIGFDHRETITVLIHELVNRPNQHGIEPGFQCYRFREPTTLELKESLKEKEPIKTSV